MADRVKGSPPLGSRFSDEHDTQTLRTSHDAPGHHGKAAGDERREQAALQQVGATERLAMGSPERKRIERRLKFKLDARFSVLVVIYILNYIDRNNAAAARLQGFEQDLGLTGQQFPTLLSILYVGYILFQVPSNMLLNHIGRPSIYLPSAMIIWGAISVLTGVTTNFGGALVTRLFLGVVEAAFLPGALFIISKWYKKDEISLRYTILYCGNLISNAFGSLIAAGVLANMQGVLGHAAWRWLFYIEGAITMFFALIAMAMLPDFPHNTRWGFSAEEIQVAQLRMLEDVGEVDQDSSEDKWYTGFVLAIKDYKMYLLTLALTSCIVGLSFNIYFPTLTKTLGYGTTETLLLAAPPWLFACLVALANSVHSDRTQEKFWHATWPLLLGIVGFIISMATSPTTVAARYVALFLQAQSYAGYVIMYTWMASSFPRPPAKRAVALAFMNALSQVGNIIGSYCWPTNFGPSYVNSYAIMTACFGLTVILNFWFRTILVKANKRLAEGEAAFAEHGDQAKRAADLEGTTVRDAAQMQKGFRFLI